MKDVSLLMHRLGNALSVLEFTLSNVDEALTDGDMNEDLNKLRAVNNRTLHDLIIATRNLRCVARELDTPTLRE